MKIWNKINGYPKIKHSSFIFTFKYLSFTCGVAMSFFLYFLHILPWWQSIWLLALKAFNICCISIVSASLLLVVLLSLFRSFHHIFFVYFNLQLIKLSSIVFLYFLFRLLKIAWLWGVIFWDKFMKKEEKIIYWLKGLNIEYCFKIAFFHLILSINRDINWFWLRKIIPVLLTRPYFLILLLIVVYLHD